MCRNQKFLHIWHVSDVENVSTYVQFMLFCCKIDFVTIFLRTFVGKSVLSRFTHFCVEKKLNQKLPLWRKNDKYEVCWGRGYALTCVELEKTAKLVKLLSLVKITNPLKIENPVQITNPVKIANPVKIGK